MVARGGLAALCVLLVAAGHAAAQPAPAPSSTCASQLAAAAPGADISMIDPDTPADACTVQICTSDAAGCDVDSPPLADLQLVMSDEFADPNRTFGVSARDAKWTAGDMWYSGTDDWEVYKPGQVNVTDGALTLTMDLTGPENETALSQQGDGVVWNASKAYKSGWVDSWNKLCFTGGYLEISVQLPGDPDVGGFWPAFWLMGNLGRAGYLKTTGGMWPWTYNECGGDAVGREFGPEGPIPQRFSACNDAAGQDRTKWGLRPNQGRGAPEIDVIEIKMGKGKKGSGPRYPFTLLPMHVSPLIPNNTFWTVTNDSGTFPGPGQYLPKNGLPDWLWTDLEFWKGPFARNQQDRPGDKVRDVMGAYAQLDKAMWTEFRTFGLHWVPGEFVRWYVDGHFVHELNKGSVVERSNGTYTVFERQIPVEPMYLIFNLAMASSFGKVEVDKLPFPSQFKLDYARLYQNASAVSVTCDPPEYPTQQYIACNRDMYLITPDQQVLVNGTCANATSCVQETNVDFYGGDILSNGTALRWEVPSVRACCEACQKNASCGAYVYDQDQWTGVWYCYPKQSSGWVRNPKAGTMSGVVYDKNSTVPRDTSVTSGASPQAGTSNVLAPPGTVVGSSAQSLSAVAALGLAAAAAALWV